MNNKHVLRLTLWAWALMTIAATNVVAGGISIDAGLTPPDGRWILRLQTRAMSRDAVPGMDEVNLDRLVVPLVIVHGISPSLTAGLRQVFDSRDLHVGGISSTTSGLGDLYFFGKYKLYRVNTRNQTLGVAGTLGVELPTGADGISSESWDLNVGLYLTGRVNMWTVDLNLGYGVQGFAGVAAADPDPGNEVRVDVAFSRQVPLGSSGRIALAPVLELAWRDSSPNAADGVDLPNTGESVFSVAPGLKYTVSDVVIEGLVRLPVVQDQQGLQLEVGPMWLLGVRQMF